MENKIMQLFMEKGEVSMNNDIFPILFEEFGNASLNEQTYAMASDFISQQLYAVYAVYAAGINVVCTPQFMGVPQTGTLFVNDIVYKVVK